MAFTESGDDLVDNKACRLRTPLVDSLTARSLSDVEASDRLSRDGEHLAPYKKTTTGISHVTI